MGKREKKGERKGKGGTAPLSLIPGSAPAVCAKIFFLFNRLHICAAQ